MAAESGVEYVRRLRSRKRLSGTGSWAGEKRGGNSATGCPPLTAGFCWALFFLSLYSFTGSLPAHREGEGERHFSFSVLDSARLLHCGPAQPRRATQEHRLRLGVSGVSAGSAEP